MAAGDTTKKLISQVRTALRDDAPRIFPTDIPLIDSLNKYQTEFMLLFETTYQVFAVTLTSGTTEYTMDPRVNRIDRAYSHNSDLEENDYEIQSDYDRRKLILLAEDEDVTTSDIIYVKAWIKPATHEVNNGGTISIVSDDISTTYDPIIGTMYEGYLAQAVIAEAKGDDKGMALTYNQVKMLSRRVK
jgi:hypothetical protein